MAGPTGKIARLGILLSGRGSNFLALNDAIERGDLPAEIAVVISNKASAAGIDKARSLGLDAKVIPHRGEPSREEHEEKIVDALRAAGVDWVCLAGYMRVLTRRLLEAFPQRVLNIHPSLLPSFPGLHAQRQAWEYGARVSGCTVHLVDAGVDTGPIVEQRCVELGDASSAEEVAAMILRQEHLAYPAALRRLLTQKWCLEDRRVRFLRG